ncbi:oxoglutarate dehydrogenase inhibitor [Abditibacteriota bacterium]|nr:oxoglutarate dehydrogenase inhibitor [Abditibacteriota bacterium]
MQQCPTCGSLNPDNADVCADCGMELPGHGATPATPASVPETPAAAPFDFAPEAAPTPDASSPVPDPAPVEAAGNDPFAGSDWNFDLNKTPAVEEPVAPTPEPEAPPVDASPLPNAIESAPTQVIEPAPAPVIPTPTPTVPTGSAKLVLKRGGAPTGDVFTIGPSATVGRFDPESGPVDVDLAQLPESVYISRHHAEVNLRDGQWLVKDLGSRNGTFVKNAAGFTRVTGETPVANGDEVAFGNARFEFQIA